MRLRAVHALPVVLAGLAIGAGQCGQTKSADTGSFKGEEKVVAQTVYDFRDAVAKRDEAKICDTYFTVALKQQVTSKGKVAGRGSTCAKAIQDSIADVDATDIKVEDVTVSGSKATVKVKTSLTRGGDPVDTLTLEKVATGKTSDWRISQLP